MQTFRSISENPAANRSTIGWDIHQCILDWAQASGVLGQLSLLSSTLFIHTDTQKALFRGVLDAVDDMAPVLKRWDLNGTNTYGMAALAAAWQRRPPYLDVIAQRRSAVGASSDADYKADLEDGKLSRQRDALFLLLQRPYPFGFDDAAHRRLRAWALIQGLRLFAERQVPDELLWEVCRTLANGALESDSRVWRDLLFELGSPADSWGEINQRLVARQENRTVGLSRHRTFLSAAHKLAKLGSKPFADALATPPSDFVPGTVWLSSIKSDFGVGLEARDDAEPSPPHGVPPNPLNQDDDDGEDVFIFDVDPERTTDEQGLHVQAVRFQLGAAARFLPWDWAQLTPPERIALTHLLEATLNNPADASERTLAALVKVALFAGMTLDEVALIPTDETFGLRSEWRIDLSAGVLIRIPPRHAGHWKPGGSVEGNVVAAAKILRLRLDPAVNQALLASQQRCASPKLLGQLWPRDQPALRGAFRIWVKRSPSTARIQSSMLARALGQTAFEQSHDHVLARLLASNQASVLPSSTVYTAYHLESLEPFHGDLTADTPADRKGPFNGAGSLLESVDDELVQCSFSEALDHIEECGRGADWVSFHNAVAAYWDAALRAATGARPVRGLWRSVFEFDWQRSEVYIDDKASPVADTGRLVPLPLKLCEQFRSLYVERHLPWLIRQLSEQSGGEPPTLAGLLFIVERQAGRYKTVELENKHRKDTQGGNLIEGRLPLNLTRHRLRTLLHREKDVDLEVVDTLFGHSDGATLTHGNFSMRVWRQDSEAIRPALTRIFDRLQFGPPPLWTNELTAVPDCSFAWASDTAPDKRSQTRDNLISHTEAANVIIAEFIAKISGTSSPVVSVGAEDSSGNTSGDETLLYGIKNLSEVEIDELSRRLVADANGMPSAAGVLRYERLLELAALAWTRHGRRVPLRKRYSVRPIEPSPFTQLAPRALTCMAALQQALDELFAKAGERSRVPLNKALCLAVYDLALVSRIANPQILQYVVAADLQWRVVRLRDAFYLEWSPSDNLVLKPSAPIQRFAISLRCAWLLQHSIRGRSRREKAWSESQAHAAPLADCFSGVFDSDVLATSDDLLSAVLLLVDQANVVELPGAVAGYLSGRVLSVSLGWGDWVRISCARWVNTNVGDKPIAIATGEGKAAKHLRLDDLPDDSDDDFDVVSVTSFCAPQDTSGYVTRRANAQAGAAFAMIAEIRTRLNGIKHSDDGSKYRARLAQSMAKNIQNEVHSVSTAIQLLCLWSIDLLLRPGRLRKLATSSVLRYFGALSPRFQAIGYEVDLATMEDSEIEDFYAAILGGATVENLRDTYDGLRNFHLFAQLVGGLPEIDWSELAVTDRIQLGSPGFIDEATYLNLMERLSIDHGCNGIANWQLQCIALLAFRFGLRGKEATGLRRADFHLDDPTVHIVVRDNRDRDLKTSPSRRVVPLLFELTPIELQALRQLRDFHCVDAIDLADGPAFASMADPTKAIDGMKARARINDHLKALTGQASSSMHKLRKGFAIRVWHEVEAPDLQFDGLARMSDLDGQRINRTLLGSGGATISRRGGWAVARLMGHAHPQTTLRSYVHVLSDVAIQRIKVDTPSCFGLTPDQITVVTLDTKFTDFTPAELGHIVDVVSTPLDALRALIFLSHGRSCSEAAVFSGLAIDLVEELDDATRAIYAKLVSADEERLRRHAENPKSRRLGRQGILSLLHINAHGRLRAGLSALSIESLQQLSMVQAITPDEWDAIVGGRREISMWRPHHFALTAFAARYFLENSSRLALHMAKSGATTDAALRLTSMAKESGWLPLTGEGDAPGPERAPLCQSMSTTERLPKVQLKKEGIRFDARIVLRLGGVNTNDNLCDSFELAVALACLNCFTHHHRYSLVDSSYH